jgi:hypothetical protein
MEKVVVLDANEIAKGTAGRNSGFIIDVPHNLSSGEYSVSDAETTALEIEQNRLAISFAAGAASEYEMSVQTFDPSGKINAAATSRGVNSMLITPARLVVSARNANRSMHPRCAKSQARNTTWAVCTHPGQ